MTSKLQVRLNARIAGGDLRLVGIDQFHRLLQGKQVLLSPVPLQGLGDGSCGVLAPSIPQSGEPAAFGLIRGNAVGKAWSRRAGLGTDLGMILPPFNSSAGYALGSGETFQRHSFKRDPAAGHH